MLSFEKTPITPAYLAASSAIPKCAVSMRIGTSGITCWNTFAASTPFIMGMEKSRITGQALIAELSAKRLARFLPRYIRVSILGNTNARLCGRLAGHPRLGRGAL